MSDHVLDSEPLTVLRSDTAGSAADEETAQKTFSTSVLVSATRCLLSYVIFPFVAPAVGLASGVGPATGIVIGVVAIVFNVLSIRRFWRADHPWKMPVSALNAGLIVLVSVLVVLDVLSLLD